MTEFIIIFFVGLTTGAYIVTQIDKKIWSLFVTYAVTRQTYTK